MGDFCRDVMSNQDSPRRHLDILDSSLKDGFIENEILRASPAILKFPQNDQSLHLRKIILWNKTKGRVDFRILAPQSKHFSLFYEKTAIFGGGEETILVKVKPFEEQLLSGVIKIQVAHAPELLIPIQLLPDISWFPLPKTIVMPQIPVGKTFEILVPLPKPPTNEDCYFFVSYGNTDVVTVAPSDGYLRGTSGTGVESLLIRYHPREYTTLTSKVLLHFPSIHLRPYDITLQLHSQPTTYEPFLPPSNFPPIKPPPTKPTKLKHIAKGEEVLPSTAACEDLTTPAAVAKFLLRPPGSIATSHDLTGVSGLTQYEDYRRYKAEEKTFYDKAAQLQTAEQNLHLQPSRVLLGEEPVGPRSEAHAQIVAERDAHRFIYDKWLGLENGSIEDLTRGKTIRVRRRGLRDLDQSLIPQKYKTVKEASEKVRAHILRPFIQAALTIITRWRAAKRIIKLRILIKERRAN